MSRVRCSILFLVVPLAARIGSADEANVGLNPVVVPAKNNKVLDASCEALCSLARYDCKSLLDGDTASSPNESRVVDFHGNASVLTPTVYRISLRTTAFVLQVVLWFEPSPNGIDADMQALEVLWDGPEPQGNASSLWPSPASLAVNAQSNGGTVRVAVQIRAIATTIFIGFRRPEGGQSARLTEIAVMGTPVGDQEGEAPSDCRRRVSTAALLDEAGTAEARRALTQLASEVTDKQEEHRHVKVGRASAPEAFLMKAHHASKAGGVFSSSSSEAWSDHEEGEILADEAGETRVDGAFFFTPAERARARKFLDKGSGIAETVDRMLAWKAIGASVVAFLLVLSTFTRLRACRSKLPSEDVEAPHGQIAPASTPPPSSPRSELGPSESEPEREPAEDAGVAQVAPQPYVPTAPLIVGKAADTPQAAVTAPTPLDVMNSTVVLMFSSPLCYNHPTKGPTPLPQIQFDREWQAVTRACGKGPGVPGVEAVVPLLATAEALQAVMTGTLGFKAEVLHLSTHGRSDCLVFDNGSHTAHFLESRVLGGLLETGSMRPPQIVFLSACSSREIGMEFVAAGVPHVVCTAAEVKDVVSARFARGFYQHLFRGHGVGAAFRAACAALRACPEAPSDAADSYVLLPEGGDHSRILFAEVPQAQETRCGEISSDCEAGGSASSDGKEPSDSSGEETPLIAAPPAELAQRPRPKRMMRAPPVPRISSTSSWSAALRLSVAARAQLTFERQLQALPAPPEDFVGRQLDVWAVLQHVSRRRVTILCGGEATCHGIGKTAVLDAVARNLMLQASVQCVRVDLHALSDMRITENPMVWVSRIVAGLRVQASAFGGARRGTEPRCRTTKACLFRGGTAPRELMDLAAAVRSFGDEVQQVVVILDEVDHLVQQRHFQDTLTVILQACSRLSVVLSTQQPMTGDLGRFKAVHHPLQPLAATAAARLFLQRCRRPLRWEEIAPALDQAPLKGGIITLTKANEQEVLTAVARHPAVQSLAGNPRQVAAQASRVTEALATLGDLAPAAVTTVT